MWSCSVEELVCGVIFPDCERKTRDMSYHPSVSIGLPVRNGEKFIRATLDALLQQNFTNYEIIISDNASTDKTEQICKEYENKFLRFTYIKNKTNIGAPKNFNQCFHLS